MRWTLLLLVVPLLACESRVIVSRSPSPGAPSSSASAAAASPSGSARPTAKPTLGPLTTQTPVSRLLSYERGGDIGQPALQLLLLADGRVIALQSSGQLFERKLTASGTASLLLKAIETGYFERDASYIREPKPGTTPSAQGATFLIFLVANGSREVRVAAVPSGQPDDNLYQPSPARDKITAFARSLEDLSWLPASAWSETMWHSYSSPFHRLFILPQPNVTVPAGEPDVDAAWPFSPEPDVVAEQLVTPGTATAWRCAIVNSIDANAIGSSFARARAISSYVDALPLISGSLAWRAQSGAMRFQMGPLFPHEPAICRGAAPPS